MSKTIYVNAKAKEGPMMNGQSWESAFTTVQGALAVAQKGAQIWVATGVYIPTDGQDRNVSFFMRETIDLYGGFAGTEQDLGERDWKKNETILSGNIGDPTDPSVNSYHVVVGADRAVLDGFTITAGNAVDGVPGPPAPPGADGPDGPPPGGPGAPPPPGDLAGKAQDAPDEDGPQIHMTPDSIIGNITFGLGAGLIIYQCAPEIRNCTIKGNKAGKGGGVYIMVATVGDDGTALTNVAPTLINCTVADNLAMGRGGGVSVDMMTHPTFIDCRFMNNRCHQKGGGMYNDFECSPTIINCLFTGNSAILAGAMGNDGGSNPVITNCTITGNMAEEEGAGVYQGTGPSNSPIITNSIIWGNICDNDEGNIANWHQCSPVVTYSCVENGYSGLGNIDQDPKFIDPENMDFRLDSMSPCIDSANGEVASATDIDGNPRYDDAKSPTGPLASNIITGQFGAGVPVIIPPVDMGAFERQEDSIVASMDIVYVKADNAGTQDGSSWETAYSSLQLAMNHAYSAGADVWVAAGTYAPSETGNREASFMLRKGVAVYGGFVGTETAVDQRDAAANETLLSGDLGGTNAYHVVVGADDALLDGFTITGGQADGPLFNKKGGGMINFAIGKDTDPFQPMIGYSPKVVNCIFKGNYAVDGGAVYNFDRCAAEFIDCTFADNIAGASGGAIMDNVGAFSVLKNCTFINNSCKYKGGALFLDYGSRPEIKGCKFDANKAGINGGAVYTISRASQLENTRAVFESCEFTKNSCGKRGGALFNFDSSYATLTKCSFSDNSAGLGGGAIATHFLAVTNIDACEFSNNSSEQGDADFDTDGSGIVNM
jgi:predicted outer membrane repeat protein